MKRWQLRMYRVEPGRMDDVDVQTFLLDER